MNRILTVYVCCIISIIFTAAFILLGVFVNYNYGWCGILIFLPFTIILIAFYWGLYNDK